MGKNIFEKVETTLTENGDVISSTSTSIRSMPSEPPFIKIYLDDICKINNLAKKASTLLYALFQYTGYNTNQILLPAGLKHELMQEMGYKSMQSLNNEISKLIKAEMLIKKSTGVFVLNPEFFGRGEWQSIKALRMTIVYNAKGQKIIKSEPMQLTTADFIDEAEANEQHALEQCSNQ